jgi:UDP-N-acetylmuramyl pentapeptide phosphotransferase/UDP-N-acetylglucosamine-1-phosphate transferase
MVAPILAGITAFAVSYAFLPFIITFSKQNQIGSSPGRRRIHKQITPSLGGAAIFSGFTIACLSWADVGNWPSILVLVSILVVPFIVGLVDDLVELTPLAKLMGQCIAATLIFFVLDVRIQSFYGLLGGGQVPVVVGYVATLLTVLAITNSLNLIDGIDGLAGVVSLLGTLAFGMWFFFAGFVANAVVLFAMSGGIMAFLFQNWEPSKIFMGDTGSLVIGTLLSIMAITFLNTNHALPVDSNMKFNSPIAVALAILIIPLTDTARIIIIRVYNRLPVFTPDKRHIHHALLRFGLQHKQIVYILALVNVCFIGLVVVTRDVPQGYVIVGIVILAAILCAVLEKLLSDFRSRRDINP